MWNGIIWVDLELKVDIILNKTSDKRSSDLLFSVSIILVMLFKIYY